MKQVASESGKTVSEIKGDVMRLAAAYKRNGMEQSEAMKRAYKEMGIASEKTTKQSKKSSKETEDSWKNTGNSLVSTFKKIGAAVGAYLAVNKIVSFGKACVEAAATVQAQNAQFEATFKDLGGTAKEMFQNISNDTGVLATRLQTVGTGAFSQFKGAGLDAAEALEKTGKYTNLAADAAAYYDMSLEEADSLMRSFIRGNTEAGDRIGLFTSETQRNEYALNKLGKKYLECTEAEKQMIMLDIASNIYESSGAMGQASREADGYENVVGNLKESWKQFMAVVGQPVLEKVIPVIKNITKKLGELKTRFSDTKNPVQIFIDFIGKAKDKMSEIADYANNAFSPAIDAVKDVFGKAKDAIQPIIDKFKEYKDSGGLAKDATNLVKDAIDFLADTANGAVDLVGGIVQGFKDMHTWAQQNHTPLTLIGIALGTIAAALVAYNGAAIIKAGLDVVETAQIWLLIAAENAHAIASAIAAGATTVFGAAMAFLTSPITLVIVAIGLLVGAVYLIAKNWDMIKEKSLQVWETIKKSVSEKIEALKTAIRNKFTEIKDKVSEIQQNIKNKASEVWNSLKDKVSSIVTGLKDKVSSIVDGMKSKVSGTFENIKSTATSVWESIKSAITKPIEAAKNSVKSAIDKMKSFFNFSWELPKIKLPHFNVSGEFSLNPPSIPHFSVEWYKKAMDTPMMFTQPTIFDMNPATGQMKGAGEAGDEVMIGKETMLNMIRQAVTEGQVHDGKIELLLRGILSWLSEGGLKEMLVDVLVNYVSININDREVARVVRKYA